MIIPCPHWSAKGNHSGLCARGLFGGRPSFGTCFSCLGLSNPFIRDFTNRFVQVNMQPTFPWKMLHEWAVRIDIFSKTDQTFLDQFRKNLTDSRQKQWDSLIAARPIRIGDEVFPWSVNLHNDLNGLIGKPVVPMVQAEQLYEPT